jgi:hypothetical protein
MGWIAGAGALIGGLSSAYGASQKPSQQNLGANFYNAYGQQNTPNSGAITSMGNIFNSLNNGTVNSQATDASGNLVGALNAASNSPLNAASGQYLQNELQGGDLTSPIVNNYANQASNQIISQGANQNARTQANFANNGLGFSTAMQQAQQAGTAATANQAATTKAGILSQNYQQERNLQQGAVGLGESVAGQPSQYLSQINSALYAPYTSQAGLTTQLLGGQTNNPQNTYVQNPNLGNAIGSGVSSASGLYSLFNSINNNNGGGNQGNNGTQAFTSDPNAFNIDTSLTCWVAREIYGAENPRWLKFREWLLNHAPVSFREDYLRNGPWWAELVRMTPRLRDTVRSFMDSKIAA